MNKDIRVDLGFFDHRKTRKLIARFGLEAAWGLLRLWAFAAKSRPDGRLSGMSNLDVLMEMHLEGKYDPAEVIGYLLSDECRFLQMAEGSTMDLQLHDWHIHNPWAAGAQDRSDASRFSRMAKTHPDIFKDLQARGVKAVSTEEYRTLTKPQRIVNAPLSPAPSPAPSPSPEAEEEPLQPKPPRKPRSLRAPFIPPTLEEVKAFCEETMSPVDPQDFFDKNQVRGWVVGKYATPMKDWKAAIRTWERTIRKSTPPTTPCRPNREGFA